MFRSVFSTGKLFRTAAGASILAGLLVLAGGVIWSNALCHTNMKPNTGLGFAMPGAALLLAQKKNGPAWRRLRLILGSGLILLMGALTLFEILGRFGISAGTLSDISHVRLSQYSAINFVLLGVSVGCLLRGAIGVSQGFAAALAASSYASLLGAWYGAAILYPFEGPVPITVISAFVFLVLAIGLLWACPLDGLMGLLNQDTYHGRLARGLVPVAVSLPALLAWIRLVGQRRGLYGMSPGSVLLATAISLVCIAGIILLTHEFGKRNAVEHQIKSDLQDRELRWSALFDQIEDGIVTLDENGSIESINRPVEQLFGYGAEELRGLHICQLLSSAYREEFDQRLASGESNGLQRLAGVGREVQGLRKDGSSFPIELCINQFRLHERRLFSGVIRDISERHAAQQMTHHFAAIVDGSGDAIVGSTLDGIVTAWNHGAEEIFGYSAQDMIGQSLFRLMPSHRPDDMQEIFKRIRRGERVESYQTERIAKDGRRLVVSLTISPLFDDNHRVIGASKIARDITEQIRLEDQLRQSQRMEAVGQLAGSIAHDFNNLLTVINGYADLSLRGIDPEDPLHTRLTQIHASGKRGAALTQHLLAFSRKQVLQAVVVNLNAIITGMEPLLRRLVREDISFHILLKPSLPSITADPHQIEQVVMNLILNARDAMPEGGSLTLETNVASFDGAQKDLFSDLLPGTYAIITITDTGVGMDSKVRSRMFEPFFTTKPKGQGTGLGLATVFGVVRQSGGAIGADSEVGVGTTFRVYLPVTAEAVPELPSEPAVATLTGSETILLVEDDGGLRSYAAEVLRKYGYLVYEAADGEEAFVISEAQGSKIDLVVCDVVMPKMGGEELVKKLRQAIYAPRVLFISGYTDDAIIVHGCSGVGVNFLAKPFNPEQLGSKVREALENVSLARDAKV